MAVPRQASDVPRFSRQFFGSGEPVSAIGTGALGGKASGLVAARDVLRARPVERPGLVVDVPACVILATDVFDAFVARNGLAEVAAEAFDDRALAASFQRAELPAEIVGDLWEIVRETRQPLAVRSSSLLEDALAHPMAGVYATKMIPNHQQDPETRFRRLVEAIKLVFASAFFAEARAVRAAFRADAEEKMAVIVQEIVGRRHGPRFYPDLSAVARSFSFYPIAGVAREDGTVDLALGLGRSIVLGERCWTSCPRRPRAVPPFASARETLQLTQTRFWAVNMGAPPPYDPTTETEHMVQEQLAAAEEDGTLRLSASTYDAASDRLRPGTSADGPRVLDFAPLREMDLVPWNAALVDLLEWFAEDAGGPVEIELALTHDAGTSRLGFLQVRPMALGEARLDLTDADLADPRVVVASARSVGNGVVDAVSDVLFLKPDAFDLKHSRRIAAEIAELNARSTGCVLVGFGRWGSADPWLGVPVAWGQISSARAIVEASRPGLHVDPSQGAHFFHNLLAFGVPYLSVGDDGASRIDWDFLGALPRAAETSMVVLARLGAPLRIEVDGWSGRGRILR